MKIKVEIEVTPKRLGDLICCGIEGGIGYWSCIVDYDKGTGEFISEAPTSGGWIDIVEHPDPIEHGDGSWLDEDGEELEVLRLDLATAKAALPRFAEVCPNGFSDFIDESADAFTGDAFIQVALLGEVRYG